VLFYQTTSELFVGLLVAVLLRAELIDGDDRDEHLTSNARRRGGLVAAISLAMAAGELVSLLVLFSSHGTVSTHIIVGVAALIGIIGTATPAVLTIMSRVLGTKKLHRSLLQMAWSLATVLCVGAFGLAYHIGSETLARTPGGSLNTPRTFHVYGTCAAGACGLNERAAPTPHSEKIGQLQDGTAIGIICQTTGYPLRTNGHTSRIWDQLANAAYVSDLYVSTPNVGTFSPELNRCPVKRITNHTQG
jgi:hypothetical protein